MDRRIYSDKATSPWKHKQEEDEYLEYKNETEKKQIIPKYM